jgi:putative hemolysin
LLALILLGEVAPKMLAYTVAPRWAMLAAGPLAVLGRVLSPILWALETLIIMPVSKIIAPHPHQEGSISVDELEALLELSTKRGLLDDDAHALLREIVQLGQLRVADVMSPRVDMLAFDIAEPRERLLDLFIEHRARFVPVYTGDVEHVQGVVFAKHLLTSPDATLAELIVPVPFVPVTARIERVLLQFRQTHHRVGIAVDEYGGTAGLITLEDILDEIVGDIPRPDAEPAGPAVKAIGGGYLIDGDLPIHEWAEAFSIDLHGGRISTMGGFVTSLLGHIPAVGDSVDYRNLRFTVDSLRGRRIGRLRIDLQETET